MPPVRMLVPLAALASCACGAPERSDDGTAAARELVERNAPPVDAPEPVSPAARAPSSEVEAPSEPRETAPTVELALAHRLEDGRIFVELPNREPPSPPDHASPVCTDRPACGFRLWAHPLPDEPTGGDVVIVRPSGELCAGRLAGHVALGVLDSDGGPQDASWRAAALVRGCTATDEPFLFAVFPGAGRSPIDGRITQPTGPAARAVANAIDRFREIHPNAPGRLEQRVWRIGEHHYVRVRPCDGPCSLDDNRDWLFVADAEGEMQSAEEAVIQPADGVCCTLVTGVVDVDGDGAAEMIVHTGYPADTPHVALQVAGDSLRWTATLPSAWIAGD